MDVSLTLILKSLSSLADVGLHVKEIEADAWAFGLLMQHFRLMAGPNEAIKWCPDDPGSMTLNLCGQRVHITSKPPLKLTLDLPPKVPMLGKSHADG